MSEQVITDADILYEDNHLIAINKRAGVLIQGDKTGDRSLTDSLAHYLKVKYQKPGNVFTGLIHRIDRPVSGLVIFSKTSKSLSRMNALFQSREVSKSYVCIVEGRVENLKSRLESYLLKNQQTNKSHSRSSPKEGYKKAVLDYEVMQYLNNYTVLSVLLATGRHHQIRVQLSAIGHVIKGDLKYGAKRSNQDGSICLHARKLSFVHPVKLEEIVIEAPLPKGDIWDQLTV